MFNGVNLDSFQVITNFKESVISHCYLDTMIKTKWFEEIPIVLKYKHHFKLALTVSLMPKGMQNKATHFTI